MRNFIRNILSSLLSVVIVLLLLEGLLRMTHLFGARLSWSLPDPVLAWRMAPSREYLTFEENTHPVLWRTNRFGWKDKEWTLKKPAGVFRIAILGDSYVESMQVEPGKNFLSLTEEDLGKTLKNRPELMNFGRSAFTQTEEWWVLQNEIMKFSPDMVILFFFPVNDIDEVARETSLDPIKPFYRLSRDGVLFLDTGFKDTRTFKLKSMIANLKQNSLLISFLTERLSVYQHQANAKKSLEKQKVASEPRRLHGYLSLCTKNPDPVYTRNYNLNKRLILEMASYLKNKGIPLMLVTTDIPAYIPDIEKKYLNRDPTFDNLFFEKDLGALAKANGIAYLGLESIFRTEFLKNRSPLHWQHFNQNDPEKLWEYGGHAGHWNYEGHSVVSRALEEKLKLLLSEKSPPSPSAK